MKIGRYWEKLEDGRVQCNVCPRHCKLREGNRGFCFVRQNIDDKINLSTYGRSSGFCIDPIEKKPLNHFYPGSSVLSFGTAGCNLACQFCQNWDISKAKKMDALMQDASPKNIAKTAQKYKCQSVAFTYNDPVIFLEYAVDVAKECQKRGIKTVAVSAGYISKDAREEFFSYMDAVNIDLKAFTQSFYKKLCFANLEPVLDTLSYIYHHTKVWLEITNLMIPGFNDDEQETRRLSQWIVEKLGPDVPLHVTAFHPDYKMRQTPATDPKTLIKAREIAINAGLNYVYTGNIIDPVGDCTYCPECQTALIQRQWYEIKSYNIKKGACYHCHKPIKGYFKDKAGTWGAKRQAIDLQNH